MRSVAFILQKILEAVSIGLLLTLAGVVISAVVSRYAFNASFRWYDEVASVMLAWITYYGAALAALQRRHLGFSGFLLSLESGPRAALFVAAEAVVYAVFVSMAWASWYVLGVMAGESLVSLEWVSIQFTQSVVPIGCVLFVIAQFVSTPDAWMRMKTGRDAEAEEIEQEIAKAEAERRAREARK